MVASLLAAACLAIAVFRRRAPVPVAASPDTARPDSANPDKPDAVSSDRQRSEDGTAAGAGHGGAAAAESAPEADAAQSEAPPAHDPPAGDQVAMPAAPADEPAEEQASSTDVLRILDLLDEVMVVDERPRYHLPSCVHLIGKDAQPLPISEARGAGFSPCALCRPDSTLADRARGQS